jgi:hypothetical protein
MVLVEAVFVIGLLGVMVYAITSVLVRPQGQRRPSSLAGTWRVAHYDAKQETHIVLQKIAAGGAQVLDEHVIARVRSDDPEYDDKFLAAMNTARMRQALFETEEGT